MSNTDKLIEKLQYDLSRKTYSFIEYVTHASPYIAEPYEPLWNLLLELREEERKHARMLSALIVRLGGIPTPTLFDESAADLNYLRIEYLTELIIRHKENSVAEFEQRIEDASGFPEARAVLLEILEAEKRQVARLRDTLNECMQKAAVLKQLPSA